MAYPANLSDLTTYIDDLGGTNTTIYTNVQRYRAFDRWMQALSQEIMDAMQNYNFQGEQATHDLAVSGGAPQREYLWPTDLLKIKRIDITFDGITWIQATEIDPSQVDPNAYITEAQIIAKFNNNRPFFYFLENGFVILSGTWASTVTGGIKVSYDKQVVGQDASNNDINNFANTTDVPNLPEFAKMWLVHGALIDFFTQETNEPLLKRLNILQYGNALGRPAKQEQIGGLLRKILNYYTSKDPDQIINIQSFYQQRDFN